MAVIVVMIIGERIRAIRELAGLTQRDIEERSGLLSCYISRVENGHTVPSLDNLDKFSRALGVPLYELFREGGEASPPLPLTAEDIVSQPRGGPSLQGLMELSERLGQHDRQFLIRAAERLCKT